MQGALHLFATRGFHGASMRDLASVIEVQPSAIYVHFPSKEHLLAELVRVGHEVHHEQIRLAMLEASADPVAQLCALVRAHVRMHTSYPDLAVIVNTELEALSPELAAPGLALRNQSIALLLAVIERGTALGRFSHPNTQVVAAAIGAMGVRIPYWYSPDLGLDAVELAEVHVQLALRMLGADLSKEGGR
ncbi:MAG TPA: TetR/AcrR family transcriptional regulator [Kofleriaceae bacterium]|nr:TetR/AcrR family transcriptional regulator [Kofleriaceae bacterium]